MSLQKTGVMQAYESGESVFRQAYEPPIIVLIREGGKNIESQGQIAFWRAWVN